MTPEQKNDIRRNIREIKKKLTWETEMCKALQIPGWTEEFKREIITSYEFYKSELGANFLKNEFDRRNHPFYRRTGNYGQWQIRELVYFAAAFKHLKEQSAIGKYKRFKSNFFSAVRCKGECIPILQVASWLIRNNFKISLEPELSILDNNYSFERDISLLKERLFLRAADLIEDARNGLKQYRQRVKNLNPTTILKKGFAIVYSDDKIVIDPKKISANSEIKTHLQDEILVSTVTKKTKNEKQFDI